MVKLLLVSPALIVMRSGIAAADRVPTDITGAGSLRKALPLSRDGQLKLSLYQRLTNADTADNRENQLKSGLICFTSSPGLCDK